MSKWEVSANFLWFSSGSDRAFHVWVLVIHYGPRNAGLNWYKSLVWERYVMSDKDTLKNVLDAVDYANGMLRVIANSVLHANIVHNDHSPIYTTPIAVTRLGPSIRLEEGTPMPFCVRWDVDADGDLTATYTVPEQAVPLREQYQRVIDRLIEKFGEV